MFTKVLKAFVQLVSTFFHEFLFVFRIAPAYAILLTILQCLIGIIPATELYVGSHIIDELTFLMRTGDWSQTLIFLVSTELILLGIQRVVFSLNDYITEFLRSYLNVAVNDRIHRLVLGLDLPTLERADVHTLITYLKDQSWRPLQMVYSFFQMFGNLVASFSYLFLAFTFSPFFTLLFFIAVLPSVIISIWAIYSNARISWGKASLMKKVWYFESLFRSRRSLIELMIHQVGAYFADQYKHCFEEVIQKELEIERRRLLGGLMANIGAFIVYIWVYIRIIASALAGFSTIGQFTLYVGAFVSLERFFVSQAWQLAILLEHTKYLNSFTELESLSPTIVDTQHPLELEMIHRVEFRHVSYQYPQADTLALSDISFVIEEGDRIAVVGENGAGKSTLIKLFLRLYEPTQGSIFINGRDYRDYTLHSLRKQIGVTFQDFIQFSLSVSENIGIGELIHAQDDVLIQEASVHAGIHERVLTLPHTYQTMLGHEYHEDGVELSGGEWQKIALARSLIKDASFLMLDEPTAALDARSEYQFFKELFHRAKKQTVLVISHRFSSVRVADTIFVFQQGKIIEQGSHEDLIKKDGLYKELYHLQTKDI